MTQNAPSPRPGGRPIGRAAFLGTVAAGVGSIALLSRFSGTVQSAIEKVSAAVPGVNQIVPTAGWRIYTVADTMPVFNPATFKLKVSGHVANPITLSWSDVEALAAEKQVTDFHCVTGWSVDKVHWEGIRAHTLVDLVRPAPSARYVTFVSTEEPYVDQLTLAQFMTPDVMVAFKQDGVPLKQEHGAPLRLVVPEMYGYKSVKWVGEIRFDTKPSAGYWEQNGYDVDAYIGKSNGLTGS